MAEGVWEAGEDKGWTCPLCPLPQGACWLLCLAASVHLLLGRGEAAPGYSQRGGIWGVTAFSTASACPPHLYVFPLPALLPLLEVSAVSPCGQPPTSVLSALNFSPHDIWLS